VRARGAFRALLARFAAEAVFFALAFVLFLVAMSASR